jgi:glycosyltransferase involved in cell wall biosynthesis
LKRTAVYIISDGIGGAEQVVRQIIAGLGEKESLFLIVNNEIAHHYNGLIPDERILNIGEVFLYAKVKHKIFRYFLKNRFYSLIPLIIQNKTKLIIRYLKENSIESIHCHLDYAVYSSILIKKRAPSLKILSTIHGVSGLVENKLLKPSLPLSSIDFRLLDKLIFVSDYVHKVYESRSIPINDYELIYNGIDYQLSLAFSRSVKTNNIFEILYVGGSKYIKGFDVLVDTIELLSKAKTGYDFHVVVLGYISDHCELVEMARIKGIDHLFKFVGFVSPPLHLSYFKSADILFMPSRSEAFPVAALEAISFDLPVIASNVGGLPELIKHEENGFLCENTPSEFLDYTIKLFSDYNKYLDKTIDCNTSLKTKFSAIKMCNKYWDLYIR